jgi:glycosyltransferase involved in cell wall biosynthesis
MYRTKEEQNQGQLSHLGGLRTGGSGPGNQLRRTLACLRFQTFQRLSVIVVHDGARASGGNGDNVEGLDLEEFRSSDFGQSIPNVAAARNLGARLAAHSSDLIVFLDCDMLAVPDLVDRHVAAHSNLRSSECVILGWRYRLPRGALYPNFDRVDVADYRAWLEKRAVKEDERSSFLAANEPNWGCFYAHNFAIRPELFFKLNGFDERFAGCGVEDIEFGYRLHQSGATLSVVQLAAAYHQFHPRLTRRWEWNIANLRTLEAAHPELRPFIMEVVADWREKIPNDLSSKLEAFK